MANECDRDPFPTAHNPAPTDNERHESSSVANTEETEVIQKTRFLDSISRYYTIPECNIYALYFLS